MIGLGIFPDRREESRWQAPSFSHRLILSDFVFPTLCLRIGQRKICCSEMLSLSCFQGESSMHVRFRTFPWRSRFLCELLYLFTIMTSLVPPTGLNFHVQYIVYTRWVHERKPKQFSRIQSLELYAKPYYIYPRRKHGRRAQHPTYRRVVPFPPNRLVDDSPEYQRSHASVSPGHSHP